MTPRADAARNRRTLIDAGRSVFAERGLQASLDDVAAAAGVGTGTAYRHFANKQALVAVILAESQAAVLADLRQALETGDPWAALAGFIDAVATRQAEDRVLNTAFAGLVPTEGTGAADRTASRRTASHDTASHDTASQRTAKERSWPEITSGVTELVERAVAAGVVRADLCASDVGFVLAMLGPVHTLAERAQRPGLWRRYLAIALAGLGPVGADPLPEPALAPSDVNRMLFGG